MSGSALLPEPRGAGHAALPLGLPAPSPLPGRIRPEAAVPCATPFDADGWLFSVDWAGSRCLLFAGEDGVRLQGERLDDLAPRFPELREAGRAIGAAAVLDGFVAVLDPEGRPDLAALAQRMAGAGTVAPAAYLATDLLHLGGAPTLGWPLERRLDRLRHLLSPDALVQLPEPVPGEGLALATAARQRGLDRLLARRGSAPYRPGVASPDRLRIALVEQADCVLAGVAARQRGWRQRLLVLAEHEAGHLAGSAVINVALEPDVVRWLDGWIGSLAVPGPALPGHEGLTGVTWLRPHLVVTVRHRGRRRDGGLVDAELLAIRDDVEPLWCRRRGAVAPPLGPSMRPGGFRPTVIVNLPLGAP